MKPFQRLGLGALKYTVSSRVIFNSPSQVRATIHYSTDTIRWSSCSQTSSEPRQLNSNSTQETVHSRDEISACVQAADATTGADDEEVYNVVQALKRLTRLYMHNDLTSCNLTEPVFSMVKMHLGKPAIVPDDVGIFVFDERLVWAGVQLCVTVLYMLLYSDWFGFCYRLCDSNWNHSHIET